MAILEQQIESDWLNQLINSYTEYRVLCDECGVEPKGINSFEDHWNTLRSPRR
jgi:hypothetical protein